MVMDMLTIYLHYEDENQEAHILQRSMMRRHVSHYDFILMIEEVGFDTIDFLYYAKKDPQGNAYFVQIEDQSAVIKMLSDPEIEKTAHLYVSKEKTTNNIAPFDHPNESVLLQDGGVSSELAKQLTVRTSHKQLRRSKRLNVIQITDQHNDKDEDFNNGEQYIAPGAESQALEDEDDRVHKQLCTEVVKRKRTSLPIVWNMPPRQRIVVKCNEESQPIGEEGAILGKFLGTIARIGGLCPLNINDWRDLKKNRRDETILQCVQTKFVYPKSCEKWILKSIGRDWRKFKSSLKKAIFNPAIEKNPDIRRKALYKLCPDDVDKDQWRGLVKFWNSKKGKAITEKNIISHSLVKNSHNAGTKSYARWSEDIRQADPEKKRPHRSTVYLATHKKKDNVNNTEKNNRLARLEEIIAQRPELAQSANGRVAWEGDALQEVLGKEKNGQVHGMGLLPTPKQVYGRTPRYLKNINLTTTDGSPCDGEDDVRKEIAKMKEHIKRLEDRNNREGYGNIGLEEENLQSNNNVVSRLPILPDKRKRVQCDGPVEARSSMQHDTSEDNNLLLSCEKDGEHDNVNQLPIQQKSSSPLGPVIDSVPEVTVTTEQPDESSARLNQQGTISKRPQSAPTKRRRTSSLKVNICYSLFTSLG
uniref:Uncharacterized protein n=1 Tax=Avena sativa TaxID=4498 RepID=A0ACD5Y818_AVESA